MRRLFEGVWLSVRLTGLAGWHAAVRFQSGHHMTYAASIAYWSLLSLFPFLLLVLAVASAVASGDSERVAVGVFVQDYLPTTVGFITRQLDEFRETQLQVGVVSLIGLVWAALGFFGAVTTAVNYAWGVDTPRSFLSHRLYSFVMLIAASLLFVVVIALASLAPMVEASWFARLLMRFPGLAALGGLWAASITTLLLIVVLGTIYYFVPNVKVRFGNVWLGAVLTGLVWRLVFAGFSWLMGDTARLSQIHGSMTAVVVFLVWIYVSAIIVLYGVQFTAVYDRLREGRRAEALEEEEDDAGQ